MQSDFPHGTALISVSPKLDNRKLTRANFTRVSDNGTILLEVKHLTDRNLPWSDKVIFVCTEIVQKVI